MFLLGSNKSFTQCPYCKNFFREFLQNFREAIDIFQLIRKHFIHYENISIRIHNYVENIIIYILIIL